MPPVAPMLAKSVPDIPKGDLSFEPKWDGFRSIIFRDGDEVEIGSRNERPMTRYFPEVVEAVKGSLPERCVVDGEIVVVVGDRLEFEVLQQRIHPAASRVKLLSEQTPARSSPSTCWRGRHGLDRPSRSRSGGPRWKRGAGDAEPPIHLTPATRDHAMAQRVVRPVRGAGLDGVVAKPLGGQLPAGQAGDVQDQAPAHRGLRGGRLPGAQERAQTIGSLLLGLYNDEGELASVGVIGAFPAARRKELFAELQPLVTTFDDHPWAWASRRRRRTPRNSEFSRWNNGKDLSFVPLRPELVVEVRYEHMEGVRFRHTAQFNRWRPDRDPARAPTSSWRSR